MSNLRGVRAALWLAAVMACNGVSHAAFHLWDVSEVYTNHDGSVQFIEFFCATSGQGILNGHTLTANSDGNVVTFTFSGNLVGSTTNKRMLLATADFGAIPGGVSQNYAALPSNFFNPGATSITLNFGPGQDIVTLAGAAIPRDGVNSLIEANPASGTQTFVAGVNSPTNFAGVNGSVNLPPPTLSPSDFNGDGDVDGVDLTAWQGGYGATGAAATSAAGNADADDVVDGADLLIWQREVTSGSAVAAVAAVPEPWALGLWLIAAATGLARPRR